MRLKKLEREQVRVKYGGRCAYCGIELGARWHADHLEPVTRELISKQNPNGTWRLDSGKPLKPENDHIGNMMPACVPCNISKGGQSLEGWRLWIARHVNSLNLYQPTYRLAKAYGLIVETAEPVVFYFEKVTNDQHSRTSDPILGADGTRHPGRPEDGNSASGQALATAQP
nr:MULTISPECIES: HNH endonuclease [unclassified Pseudomonas]